MTGRILGTVVLTSLLLLGGCAFDEELGIKADYISIFDFESGSQGWKGGIADYPVKSRDSIKYVVDNLYLPSNMLVEGNGLKITAENHHRDLFYYFVHNVTDLKPKTRYEIDFEFLLYVEVNNDIKKKAGEGMYLKIGGVDHEPMLVTKTMDNKQEYMVLNIDKGDTNIDDGKDLVMVGDVTSFAGPSPEVISGNTFDKAILVKTDANGALWLVVGVDSGIDAELTFGLAAITVYYKER